MFRSVGRPRIKVGDRRRRRLLGKQHSGRQREDIRERPVAQSESTDSQACNHCLARAVLQLTKAMRRHFAVSIKEREYSKRLVAVQLIRGGFCTRPKSLQALRISDRSTSENSRI